MSTLGERIKTARESKGYLQSDLAKLIGVKSSGVISNWEKDLNKPDAEKIVKICEVLNVSASFLLNYYGKSTFECAPSEQSVIEEYRLLDEHGKDIVDTVLSKEYDRCKEQTVTESTNIIQLKEPDRSYLEPEAAHERTDIETTLEGRQHDDDIMNDDSEWE